jgi:hypothetical protein
MGNHLGVHVNPLHLPKWNIKKKKPLHEVEHFLGIQNEVVRDDADAKSHITIKAAGGIRGSETQTYKVEHIEGQSLGQYLGRLKLKRAGIYSAVYDQTNLSNGRCRMTYVPKGGAVITIGGAKSGSATHLQRTNHDAQRIAANMAGGAKVVEVKK